MSILHLPENIKVHFASMENKKHIDLMNIMGVQYALYTAFPFVYKKLFGKKGGTSDNDRTIPIALEGNMKHVIQDSGLFSMLYGSKQHLATNDIIYRWYDAYVEWTLEHGQMLTVVELDCQDVLGQKVAWELRERLRADLPKHRIMNVFHLSDGKEGLDRLIEYSDYLGIPSKVPYKYELAKYIKTKKPDIDIHLLGCTDAKLLQKCSFCTSCDSISWVTPLMFGFMGDYHIYDLDKEKVVQFVGEQAMQQVSELFVAKNVPAYCASIEICKRQYQKYGGNQDFLPFNKSF